MIALSANLTVIPATVNYVDFAGNIGGVSPYGKALYGQALYSRIPAFALAFAGDFNLLGQQFLAGNLAPVVAFSGNLAIAEGFVGDLAPIVAFGGNLILNEVFAGGLAPVVTFSASLSITVSLTTQMLDGGFYFNVAFGASSMISGPLWAVDEPCPSPPWGPIEPCPPSLWTPTGPCDPVEWDPAELCNG